MGSIIGIFAFLIFFIVVVGITRIDAGYSGIKVNFTGSDRGVDEHPYVTGWCVYNKMSSKIIEYPLFAQNVKWTASLNEGSGAGKGQNEEITFGSKEGTPFSADIAVTYSIGYKFIPKFYSTYRVDNIDTFTTGPFRDIVRKSFGDIASRYTADEIMGEKKVALQEEVRKLVEERLSVVGISVSQLGFIGFPRPPKPILDSITQKVEAYQKALKSQTEKQYVEAEAAKQVAEAKGKADAKIASAEGEAKANNLLTKSITPELIAWENLQIRKAEIAKWNGQKPLVEGNGAKDVNLWTDTSKFVTPPTK